MLPVGIKFAPFTHTLAKRTASSVRSRQQEEEEEKEQARPKRRAAKNISSGSYLEEDYTESPMSDNEETCAMEEKEKGKEKGVKKGVGRPAGGGAATRKALKGKKYPKIKVKMIRRQENSPIFLAQSMDEVSLVVSSIVPLLSVCLLFTSPLSWEKVKVLARHL